MTPELLALLTPKQQEAWERCQKVTPGPWQQDGSHIYGPDPQRLLVCQVNYIGQGYQEESAANEALLKRVNVDLPAALLELAQAKHALAELRAAVADAPHDMWCAVTFPAAPADLMACNCWKSETK